MPLSTTEWTVERLHALPDDGNRYEIVDGELFVTPAPTWRHQDAAHELVNLLDPYLSATRAGRLYFAPADLIFGPRTVVEPDLFVVPLVDGRAPRSWEEAGRLLLAVEILSPGTARSDRHVKRRLYQRERVPEYWIVDVDAGLVDRWRPGATSSDELAETLEWRPDPAHDALVIDLPAYFAGVRGE